MWFFKAKPKAPQRSVIDGVTVQMLLDRALKGRKRADYRHIPQKGEMSVVTTGDIEAAAKQAYRPWLRNCWECEQQALEVVQCAQKIAANEGRSWAMGILRAVDPSTISGLHVMVWAVVQLPDGRGVVCYDATNRHWRGISTLTGVDYTLT